MFKCAFALMWRVYICRSQCKSDPGCSKCLTLYDSLAVRAALCSARREVRCCSASQDVSASNDWTREPQAHSQSLFSPLSPIATAVWLVQVLQGEEWVNGERRDRKKSDIDSFQWFRGRTLYDSFLFINSWTFCTIGFTFIHVYFTRLSTEDTQNVHFL